MPAGSWREARRPVEERFWDKVQPEPNTGCWLWLGSGTPYGYGMIGHRYKKIYAHRLSYEMNVGPMPSDRELDHLCRNRWCVNPDHLEPVTHRVNTLRGTAPSAQNARKTHCKMGHVLDDNNTYHSCGRRICRICTINKERAKRGLPLLEIGDPVRQVRDRQKSSERPMSALARPKTRRVYVPTSGPPNRGGTRARPAIERFWEKVQPEPMSGCWIWMAGINPYGYGVFSGDNSILAHRFAYAFCHGPISEGLHIDHKCRTRCCVNPDHLEAVLPDENLRRGWAARRKL